MTIPPKSLPSAGGQWVAPRFWRWIPDWLSEALRFLTVGVLNTLLDAGLYFVFSGWVWVLPAQKVFAKSLSYSAGILNSFFWNRAWTFKSRVDPVRALLPFVAANLFALGINVGIMHLALNVIRVDERIAWLLATAATFVWNFTISKFYVFSARPPLPQGE